MGNLLSYFSSHPEVVLKFHDVEPPQGDERVQELFARANGLLEETKKAIDYLNNYTGNNALVQKAMKHPNDDAIRAESFQGMFPNIKAIKGFYELSQKVDLCAGDMLKYILHQDGTPMDTVTAEPALVTRFALLLEAIFIFDWAKMKQPAVQNDFSFYRRELSKNVNNPNIPVDDTMASVISMFVAQAGPMLSSLSNSLILLSKSLPSIAPFLGDFINVCNANAQQYRKTPSNNEVVETLYLAMVVAIVLYDKIDSLGAFAKSSPVEIKKCVQSLTSWDNPHRENCLSTLQYSTKTFNNA
eukprot:CAMPEP_0203802028 /NCGR_PEP_ID=MMETSP0100_2-20121128/11770_1 /ASSEMBLY_ACC=CAM_ASM_000210 /TAXON_ID=96639 /ORGANISM=" , Strain NY0313808BC1" /LENGTH=299 /DNA_ID=CAMNT_0050709027 /DNA_START=634 /DNA_END=1529 /DNA_ORIENTATION=-